MLTLPKPNTEEFSKEVVYKSDGKKIDKIIEKNTANGNLHKITFFDYFDNSKIKSIEDYSDGIKIRTTNFSLFKSVTDYDKKTGKKYKVTNFDIKDENKKTSVYDYDLVTGNLIQMTVYRTDGNNIAFVKEISPETGEVKRCINYKKGSSAISSVSTFETLNNTTVKTTYYYSTPVYLNSLAQINKQITEDKLNKKILFPKSYNKVTRLIDNLYKNKPNISNIAIN
jgi:hypothetical protein